MRPAGLKKEVPETPSPISSAKLGPNVVAVAVAVFVLAALVGDLAAGERQIGSAARSPAAFLAFPALAVLALACRNAKRGLTDGTWALPPFAIGLALVTVTAFLVGAFRTSVGPAEALGQSPIIKALTQTAAHFLWLAYVVLGVFAAGLARQSTRKILALALTLLLLLVMVEVFLKPAWITELGALHARTNFQHRPRALFAESSLLGGTAAMLGAVLTVFAKTRRSRTIYFLLATTVILISQSRGAMFTWLFASAISVVPFAWEYRGTAPSAWAFIVIFVAALFAPAVLATVDFQTDESFESRLSYEVTTLEVLAKFPLGMGFGGYLYDAQEVLQAARGHLDFLFPRVANYELLVKMTQGDDSNLYPKALLAVLVWPAGWIGLLAAAFLVHSQVSAVAFEDHPTRFLALVSFGVYFTFAAGFDQPLLAFLLGITSRELWIARQRRLSAAKGVSHDSG